jgi:hypothetical protein
MKTILRIIPVFAIMIFFMAPTYACTTGKKISSKNASQYHHSINKTITYPEFAKSNRLEGFVLVQYKVNSYGKIEIDAINGSDNQLISYVQKQFGNLILIPGENRDHYAKFVFKLY